VLPATLAELHRALEGPGGSYRAVEGEPRSTASARAHRRTRSRQTLGDADERDDGRPSAPPWLSPRAPGRAPRPQFLARRRARRPPRLIARSTPRSGPPPPPARAPGRASRRPSASCPWGSRHMGHDGSCSRTASRAARPARTPRRARGLPSSPTSRRVNTATAATRMTRARAAGTPAPHPSSAAPLQRPRRVPPCSAPRRPTTILRPATTQRHSPPRSRTARSSASSASGVRPPELGDRARPRLGHTTAMCRAPRSRPAITSAAGSPPAGAPPRARRALRRHGDQEPPEGLGRREEQATPSGSDAGGRS